MDSMSSVPSYLPVQIESPSKVPDRPPFSTKPLLTPPQPSNLSSEKLLCWLPFFIYWSYTTSEYIITYRAEIADYHHLSNQQQVLGTVLDAA